MEYLKTNRDKKCEVIRNMIKDGVDVNHKSKGGKFALLCAASDSNVTLAIYEVLI